MIGDKCLTGGSLTTGTPINYVTATPVTQGFWNPCSLIDGGSVNMVNAVTGASYHICLTEANDGFHTGHPSLIDHYSIR